MGLRTLMRPLIMAAGLMPGTATADWFAAPSLSVMQFHDDNLFSSATQPESDRVRQARPALEAGQQSARWALAGRYAFDAESYAEHEELDNDKARERAGMDWRYEVGRGTTLATDAAYARTNRPSELNPALGVESGRASAEAFTVHPGLTRRVDPRTVVSTGYTYAQERLAGGAATDTYTLAGDFGRDLSRRDHLQLGYTYRRFVFDGADQVTAHTFVGGITREFTPRTSGTLLGGPRFSEGAVDPELSASVRHLLEPGQVSLSYARGLSTSVGQPGAITTEALEVAALRPIGRAVELRAAARWSSATRGDFRAEVQRAGLEASYRVSELLSLIGSYETTIQQGSLDALGPGDITRSVFMLGVSLGPPARARKETNPDEEPPGSPADDGDEQ